MCYMCIQWTHVLYSVVIHGNLIHLFLISTVRVKNWNHDCLDLFVKSKNRYVYTILKQMMQLQTWSAGRYWFYESCWIVSPGRVSTSVLVQATVHCLCQWQAVWHWFILLGSCWQHQLGHDQMTHWHVDANTAWQRCFHFVHGGYHSVLTNE